jgi:CBS domain-containing protein
MQVRDVMTHEVITVRPGTTVRDAAELMVAGGFAALPVVDDSGQVVGMVAEADLLSGRLPEDPRLHLRRSREDGATEPPPLVGGVMTRRVRSVDAAADVADVARIVVQEKLRSLPVMDGGRLAGIVSRRDLLRTLARPDAAVRDDVLAVTEEYTGCPGCWEVDVTEGVATIRRTSGEPGGGADVEARALRALALTVGGVTAVRTPPAPPAIRT